MALRKQATVRFAAWIGLVSILALAALTASVGRIGAQPPGGGPPKANRPQTKPSVSVNDSKAFRGYTLVAPMNSTKVHLIDLEGRIVKTWETGMTPGLSTYLLENGDILRAANLGAKGKHHGPGAGGRILEMNWAGEVVWDFSYANDKAQQHHDIHRMPNGNVLMIVWDKKTPEEAVAAGRRGLRSRVMPAVGTARRASSPPLAFVVVE